MPRILLYLCICLSFSCAVFSQRYIYSKDEIRFDQNREQVRIIPAPEGLLHIWKYGFSGVSLSVFNSKLELIQTKKIPTRLINPAFMHIADFYYVILSDSGKTEIYAIEKDGTITERTKTFAKQKLTLGVHHSYFFRQGKKVLFLLQQTDDVDQQQSFLHLTALDSNLQYINKIVLKIEYLGGRPQRLLVSAMDDQLLLLNHTINKGKGSLAFTSINVVNGTFFTKLFYPEGLSFISHQLLFDGNEIILKSQVRDSGQWEERPKNYTYLIKMDQQLKIINHLYLNPSALGQSENPLYFYNSILTTVLPGKQLLSIDLGKKGNKKLAGPEQEIRFLWIDSALKIVKSFNHHSEEGKYFPSFVFNSGKKNHFYYEEAINSKSSLINTYEIGDSLVNDKPLLLTPSYRYLLRLSFPLSESHFVMPYVRNYHLGLVKINAEMD